MSHATATALLLDASHRPPPGGPDIELIDNDETPLESDWHENQGPLLRNVLRVGMDERGRDDYTVGVNMFVYYSPEQARDVVEEVRRQLGLFDEPDEGSSPRPSQGEIVVFPTPAGREPKLSSPLGPPKGKMKTFRGPDLFVVMGDVVHYQRKYWVSWREGGRLPDFVLELMSKSTADVDLGKKKEIYARDFGSREYFVYGPDDEDLGEHRDVLKGFRLTEDATHPEYELIEPDARGLVWSEVLGFHVGRWDGEWERSEARWLRLYDARGRLIPTDAEAERRRAEAAEARAEAERRQKEAERRRALEAEAEVARLRKLLETGG